MTKIAVRERHHVSLTRAPCVVPSNENQKVPSNGHEEACLSVHLTLFVLRASGFDVVMTEVMNANLGVHLCAFAAICLIDTLISTHDFHVRPGWLPGVDIG